jgi:hypothetical protein
MATREVIAKMRGKVNEDTPARASLSAEHQTRHHVATSCIACD